jgi:hypothetical protein
MSALVLGVINIALIVAILFFVGLLVAWFARMAGYPIPRELRMAYFLILLILVIYMVAALLLGLPSWRVV